MNLTAEQIEQEREAFVRHLDQSQWQRLLTERAQRKDRNSLPRLLRINCDFWLARAVIAKHHEGELEAEIQRLRKALDQAIDMAGLECDAIPDVVCMPTRDVSGRESYRIENAPELAEYLRVSKAERI